MEPEPQPVLRHWRLILSSMLLGEVTGHPHVGDGWIITSGLVEPIDYVAGRARSHTTLYRLAEPWPDSESMPEGARGILMAWILQRVMLRSVDELPEAFAAVNKIVDELAGPISRRVAPTGIAAESREAEMERLSKAGIPVLDGTAQTVDDDVATGTRWLAKHRGRPRDD